MTLANQYNCTLMTVQDADDDTRVHNNVFVEQFKIYMESQPQERFNYASISGETTKLVGQMPAAFFTTVLYTSRDSIESWRNAEGASKAKAARELDYAIKRATSQTNRNDDIKNTFLRGIIAIVLATIGWALDKWELGGNGIWLSAGIAFLISVGPEIVDLFNSLRDFTSGPETFFAQF